MRHPKKIQRRWVCIGGVREGGTGVQYQMLATDWRTVRRVWVRP
jgi:hypothetical protein